MPRRKMAPPSGKSAPWITTFADLMNLLVCFFIMIVAYSDINANKFQQMSISIANSIGMTSNTMDNQDTTIGTGINQIAGLAAYFTQLELKGTTGNRDGTTGTKDGTSSSETMNIDQALTTLNQEMATQTKEMYDQVSDMTEQYHLTDYVSLNSDPDYKYIEISLKGSLLYESGSAEIKTEALKILDSIAKILLHFDKCQIEVTGYTDNVPLSNNAQYKDNLWLSSARALNAAEYLINSGGLEPSLLKYSGRGEYEPVASNATPEGRARNRRIEIKIYNQYSS